MQVVDDWLRLARLTATLDYQGDGSINGTNQEASPESNKTCVLSSISAD